MSFELSRAALRDYTRLRDLWSQHLKEDDPDNDSHFGFKANLESDEQKIRALRKFTRINDSQLKEEADFTTKVIFDINNADHPDPEVLKAIIRKADDKNLVDPNDLKHALGKDLKAIAQKIFLNVEKEKVEQRKKDIKTLETALKDIHTDKNGTKDFLSDFESNLKNAIDHYNKFQESSKQLMKSLKDKIGLSILNMKDLNLIAYLYKINGKVKNSISGALGSKAKFFQALNQNASDRLQASQDDVKKAFHVHRDRFQFYEPPTFNKVTRNILEELYSNCAPAVVDSGYYNNPDQNRTSSQRLKRDWNSL